MISPEILRIVIGGKICTDGELCSFPPLHNRTRTAGITTRTDRGEFSALALKKHVGDEIFVYADERI